jgi:NAD(P)-dependent dehydrogenase (short-subunit alcohol dehydrogenase family)
MSAKEAFAGGVAVVTGAGSGIGEGIVRQAASLGMRVVLAEIAVDRAEKVAADIRGQGGEALVVATDVSKPGSIDQLADQAYAAFGDVRLLVNNAGIETVGFTWEIPVERWERTLDINIHGMIHGCRAFAPRMLASPDQTYIANVASVGGLGMAPVQVPYILSKHAILSFTEGLYLEMQMQPKPVSVSAVLPGPVATRIFADANRDGAGEKGGTHREIMDQMLTTVGMTGLEAGRIILEGIAARQFWVSTHPEMMADMAKARAHHLANLAAPAMNEQMRQTLVR